MCWFIVMAGLDYFLWGWYNIEFWVTWCDFLGWVTSVVFVGGFLGTGLWW